MLKNPNIYLTISQTKYAYTKLGSISCSFSLFKMDISKVVPLEPIVSITFGEGLEEN